MTAISNDFSYPMYYTTEYMDWVMREIAYSGISHVQWQFSWEGNHEHSKYEMEQILGYYEKYNLKAKGIHASDGGVRRSFAGKYKHNLDFDNRKDYLSFEEANRKSGVLLIQNHMDLAKVIGAEEIVLHVQAPKTYIENIPSFKKKFFTQLFKSMDSLVEHSAKTNVKVAVENIIGIDPELQCEIFDRLFDKYEDKYLGLCYDSGHNMVVNPKSPYSFLEKYTDRIIAVHLQDVHAPLKDLDTDDRLYAKSDNHLVPFDGILNWDYIMDLLSKTKYKLPLMIESCSYEGEFHATFLKRNKFVADRLNEMFLEKQKKNGVSK